MPFEKPSSGENNAFPKLSILENLFSESSTYQDRLECFLENAMGTDVEFTVGASDSIATIPAHKVILASSSLVFSKMFFGDLGGLNEIVVPDCDPEAFKLFIKFLYTNTLPEASLMENKASDLLFIARKYFCQPLETHCITYLQDHINPDTILDILEAADLYTLPQLTATCWGYIEDNTAPVLETQLKTLSSDKLCTILENDFLNIKEIDLFDFVVRWAKYKCEEAGIEPTPENSRIAAERAFNLIRYPTINPADITNYIAPSNILSSNQITNLYKYIYATNKSGLVTIEFNTKPREWEKKEAQSGGTGGFGAFVTGSIF